MKSQSAGDLDRSFLWHPFTPMRAWLAEPPLVIERGEGNLLIDVDGNRYIDGVASLWVNVHGHRHPHIDAAMRLQIDKIAHSTLLGLGNSPSIHLAAKLMALAPAGLARAFLSDSGSTAVEVAAKIAFQYHILGGNTRRTKFLVFDQGYHGDTVGSVSLGAIDEFHRVFHPLLFKTIRSKIDIAHFIHVFETHKDDIAAVVMEPLVQGAAGIRLMPPGLLATAAEICRRHDVLLIADEVATGFGRTGTLFACEQENVTPDLLCVAKGLSGGYLPVAATLATDAVFSRFLGAPDQRLTFFHGHSFGGNPLGCAAALASLEVFEQENTIAKLPPKIDRLRHALAALVAPLPHVAEIRQRGLMVGIELAENRARPFAPARAIGARVCSLVRKHGVILRPLGDVIVIMPPLSITLDEIDRIVAAAAAAIAEATAEVERGSSGAVATHGPHGAARSATSSPEATVEKPFGLFIAGTDTGVGKTTCARALLRLAVRAGLAVVPGKPIETGCTDGPTDARALATAARSDRPIADICPFALRAPLAPSLAAAAAGRPLSLAAVITACRALARPGAAIVIESAGGLLTPIEDDKSNADLAAHLGLPVLLVARNALGTINHTALTIAEIRRRGLPLAGVVLCDTDDRPGPDHDGNAAAIAQLTGVVPLGILPFVTFARAAGGGTSAHTSPDAADALADAMARAFDPAPLLAHVSRRS